MTEKVQLYVEETRYTEYGYNFTKLVIRDGKHESLDALIEQCVDNKVGYGDGDGYLGIETAARMGRRYAWLKSQGYTACHDDYASVRLEMTWQHYGANDYCNARIDLPCDLGRLQATYKVLTQLVSASNRRKVGGYLFRHNPKYALDVLNRQGAIAVERVKIPDSVDNHGLGSMLCVGPSVVLASVKVAS